MVFIGGFAVTNTVSAVLMNRFIEEYDLISGQQGLVSGMIQFGSVLALLLTPVLQGRVKKTIMLGFSGLLISTTMALTGLSPNFIVMLAVCLLLGVGGGWTDNYINSMMADLHKRDGSRSMSALHGWYGLGALCTPIAIQGFLLLMGWRSVYYVLTGLSLAAVAQFIIVASIFREELSANGGISEQKMRSRFLKEYFLDRYNILLVISGMLYAASQTSAVSWLVRFMAVTYDAESMGAFGITLVWGGITLSRFLALRLKVEPLFLFSVGILLSGAASAIGILGTSPILMVIMAAFVGFFGGPCLPMIFHESISRFPGNTSVATSLMMFATKIPMMLIPILIGVVASVTSLKSAMLMGSWFSLIGSAFSFWAIMQKKKAAHEGKAT